MAHTSGVITGTLSLSALPCLYMIDDVLSIQSVDPYLLLPKWTCTYLFITALTTILTNTKPVTSYTDKDYNL